MSVKTTITFILGLIVFGFVTYMMEDYLSRKHDLAQINFSPSGLTRSVFSSKGTSQRIIPVNLKFNKVSEDSQRVHVTATFSLPFDFDGKLYYSWELGEGVQIQSGLTSGELDSQYRNKTYEVSIEVTHFSTQRNRTIGFEIDAAKNGWRIYGDALAASNIESTFEHIVQNVERLKKMK